MTNGKLMDNTVTLYHKTGETGGRAVYERYVMTFVLFDEKSGVLPVLSGQRPYNSFKLFTRVPGRVEDGYGNYLMYCDKFAFDALLPEQREVCWSVSEGDFITAGITAFDMTSLSLDSVKAQCEVYTVNIITPGKLRGMRFLEISGRGRVLE